MFFVTLWLCRQIFNIHSTFVELFAATWIFFFFFRILLNLFVRKYLKTVWSSLFDEFDFNRHLTTKEADAVVFHIVADETGNLLVESSQKDRAYHNCGIDAEAAQKAGAFQCDVRGSDQQSFARMVRQRKEIVRRNAVLFGAGNVGVAWATARCNKYVFGRYLRFLLLLICRLPNQKK